MNSNVAPILPCVLEGVSFVASGRTIIDRIDATLEAGPRTVILGANGAGKSVLMRLCHGLLAPTSGRITWQSTEAARHQAMLFQRPVMLRRSAAANVAYALQLAGIPRARRDALVADALRRVGLERVATTPARVLSGGEQQRLAMARAWALAPQVLFLDEPTASLDPASSREIERGIAALHADGTKIVMTTHHLGLARRLADEIWFIHDGRLLECTLADAFFRAPASAEAADFLRAELAWG